MRITNQLSLHESKQRCEAGSSAALDFYETASHEALDGCAHTKEYARKSKHKKAHTHLHTDTHTQLLVQAKLRIEALQRKKAYWVQGKKANHAL